MRYTLPLALIVALTINSASHGWDLCNALGIRCPWLGCGNSCDPGCGCDPSGCGYEVSCGCEPGCGCSGGCVNGGQFAGQTWNCCDSCNPPICPCTGPECSDPGCGCGTAGGCGECCEPACSCDPSCGAGTSCGGGGCCLGGRACFFDSCCGRFVGLFDRLCGTGCGGCSNEIYWSEWHNDPPRCCDPCDQCGNWTGPSYGNYRAPYGHPYSFGGYASGPYYAGKSAPHATSSRVAQSTNPARPTFAGQAPAQNRPATRVARGVTNNPFARKPATGSNAVYQR
jgi:hypothetical protein